MRNIIFLLTLVIGAFQLACTKNPNPLPPPTQTPGEKKILLKDIVIPNLPSPYYHFEYSLDSLIVKADFASGYTRYDIFRSGNRISEMRNNIAINHDTLRYFYDNAARLSLIKFINEQGVVYRQAKFTYNGELISNIEWDLVSPSGDIVVDRTVTFAFYADGNLKTIEDHRLPQPGHTESTIATTFSGYDNKINVDDFSLIHDGIHDHLFLPQGFRLQKGNPAKEIVAANGIQRYIADYTYDYKADGTPTLKKGSLLYTSGADSGKRFNIQTQYSYY